MSAYPNATGVMYSGGPAHTGVDKTGGPISSGSCSQCHGSATTATTVTLEIKDASNNVVTEYIGGNSYKVKVQVSNPSYSNYGFQLVALKGPVNQSAGSFTSFLTANSQVSSLAGRAYFEHDGVSPTGIFEANWTAPAALTGDVSFYFIGNAVNLNGGTSGDAPSSGQSYVLQELEPVTVTYANDYCTDATSTTPLTTGNSSGTYTTSSSDITVNATTGEIDMTSTLPGTYTITYTYSSGTIDNTVNINESYLLNLTEEICDGDSAFLAGDWQLTAGVYTDVYNAVNGCDSTVVTDLILLESYSVDVDTMICQGDSVQIDGMWQLDEGVYSESFAAVNSCDSTVNYNLMFNDYDAQITPDMFTILVSANNANSVEIYDCDEDTVVEVLSANGGLFGAPYTGLFAVRITGDDCVYESECFNVTTIGIEEEISESVEIYPNPSSNELNILNLPKGAGFTISVYNMQGKEVKNYTMTELTDKVKLDISDIENGVYLVKFQNSDYQFVKRVLKN